MSPKTICCGCNVYILATILTILEFFCLIGFAIKMTNKIDVNILLAISLSWVAYLGVEYVGIRKKITSLIIFGCIGRIILSIAYGIAIIVVSIYPNFCDFNFIDCSSHFMKKIQNFLTNR